MGQYWDSVADRSEGQFTSDELESTAYRLVTEQVLYYSDRHSRTAYWMVDAYERDFRQALAPLGVNVHVNRKLRFAYAVPQHAKAGSASIGQTILALVLRMIYDEYARNGQVNDDGEVVCDLEELQVKYRELSGREMPAKGKLDAQLEVMKRWGIARKSEDHASDDRDDATTQPYVVIIRPAIYEILGETVLQHLSRFKEAAVLNETDEEAEETAGDSSPEQGTEGI